MKLKMLALFSVQVFEPNIILPTAKLEPSTGVYINLTKSEKQLMCPMLCPVNFSIPN